MSEQINDYINKIINLDFIQALKMTFVHMTLCFVVLGIIVFFQWFSIFYPYIECIYFLMIQMMYAFQYIQRKKLNPVFMLFSVLLSMLFICYGKQYSILTLTLPVLFVHMIYLAMIHRMSLYLEKKIHFFIEPIEAYFKQLVPVFIAALLIMGLIYCQNIYIGLFISCVQLCLSFLTSIIGILLIVVLTCGFWLSGIHGVAMVGILARPFWTQMLMVNLICYINHQAIPYIGVEGFYQWFVWIGGSGATLGLVLLCRFFAKSHYLRQMGHQTLQSGLININEPVIFGAPIVQNRYLRIPFLVAPIVMSLCTYIMMAYHYINIPVMLAPWVLPSVFGGFWATGGQIFSILYIIGMIIVSLIIYLPFFICYDRQLVKEENA